MGKNLLYQKPFHAKRFCVQLRMLICLYITLGGQLNMLTQLIVENLTLVRCKSPFIHWIEMLENKTEWFKLSGKTAQNISMLATYFWLDGIWIEIFEFYISRTFES